MTTTGGLSGIELAEHETREAKQNLKAVRRRVLEIWMDMVSAADDMDDSPDGCLHGDEVRAFADELLEAVRGHK